jgi:hypothetical protein
MIRTAFGEMTEAQADLLECALRVLGHVSPLDWGEIPEDLRACFERYMDKDVWTGGADLETYREAAVLILRDAIAHRGEFAETGA